MKNVNIAQTVAFARTAEPALTAWAAKEITVPAADTAKTAWSRFVTVATDARNAP